MSEWKPKYVGVAAGCWATGGRMVPGAGPPREPPTPTPEKVLKQGDVTVRILWPEDGRASMVKVNDCGGVWDGKQVTRCAWSFCGDEGKRVLDTAARLIRKWEQR